MNVLDLNKSSQLLPSDVDKIVDFNEYTCVVVYTLNDRYFPYNYKNEQILMNANGSDIPISILGNGCLVYYYGNYEIIFGNENGNYTFYEWRDGNGHIGNNLTDKENTPQLVIDMYSRITGQYLNVTEGFKRMVNRMNEAIKLSYKDIID